MVASPAKRAKVAHSTGSPSLRDLFARSTAQQRAAPQHGASPAPSNRLPSSIQQEEDELRWAIAESLKEANKQDFVLTKENEHGLLGCKDEQGAVPPTPSEPNQRVPTAPTLSKMDSEESIQSVSTSGESQNDVQTPLKSTNEQKTNGTNAFSKLMSTHSEAKEWSTADVVEAKNYTGAARSRVQHRTAPFYKVLTGMPISVDAFRFGEIPGCTAYFLSHFHADHYGGCTSAWSHGPIYCSLTTANLVRSSLRVQDQFVCPLPMNETVVIPHTGGVKVTLLDANHCPGSCIFLFEGPQTCHILPTQPNYSHPALAPPTKIFRYLHCGDFRASPRHANHPLIKGRRLDIIYLDTTYCNPRYCFPAQEMVVKACADMLRRVVPEQCRRAELMQIEVKEEDWRTSPLKGRKLEQALKAEEDLKGANALRGWLDGTSRTTSDEALIKDAGVKEEDPEDLGTLDFEDEVLHFAPRGDADDQENQSDKHWADEQEETGDEDGSLPKPDEVLALTSQEGARTEHESSSASINVVKQEEDDELEMNEAAGLGGGGAVPAGALSLCKEEKDIDPDRKDVLAAIDDDYPRALVVVGTYTIGKEKIVLACAKALGTRIYCADPRKYRVYAQLEDPELHSLLTRDPMSAYVHVTSLMAIGGDALQEHASKMRSQGMRIDRAIAFRPTGWTYRPPNGMDFVSPSLERLLQWNQRRTFSPSQMFPTRDSTAKYSIYGVPYSEHSSFFELTAFSLSVEYGRIIPTVNVGNPTSRAKMARWFDKWKAEKKRRNGVPIEPRSDDFF